MKLAPGKPQNHESGKKPQIQAVDRAPHPDEQETAAEGRDRVEAPEVTVAQAEIASQLIAEERDEEGLPETRRKGQKEPKPQESRICEYEGKIAH